MNIQTKKLVLNPETLRSLTEQESLNVDGAGFPWWTIKFDANCTATTSQIDTACC